ncbi:MAG: GNAT family N-acetyltransferase, partial [Phycisphaerae bacterium]
LMACRGDRVVGVLPLFEIRSFLAGRLLVSVPYATYGGVLAEDDDAAAALFQEAKSLGARIQARSIELRSRKAAFDELDIRRTHATFERRLPADPERVIDLFPRKARAAARRASERYDLRVTFGDEQLPELWRLYARSMRRLASPNYPYRFFESLAQAMPDGHVAQVVRWEGRPVAGLLTLLYRETAMPYFIGLDERVDVYGLSHYLYRQSMRWAVEHGYRIYDFGRTRVDNAGPFAFKKHCGFEPTMLEYQVYVPPGRSAPDLSPASPRWTAARRLWRRLPLPITRPLGGWLARSIPG